MISRISTGTRLAAAGFLALSGALVAAAPAQASGTASAADERWLVSMHQAHLTEIAAGRDAVRYAQGEDVKKLAEDLVDDHSRLDQRIVALGNKYDVFMPTRPTDAQQNALVALQSKEGEAYDGAWIRSRLTTHQEVREAAEKESSEGEAADVKQTASDAVPVLRRHEEDLNRLAGNDGLGTPEAVSGGTGGQAAAAAASASRPAVVLAVIGVALLAGSVVAAVRGRRTGG